MATLFVFAVGFLYLPDFLHLPGHDVTLSGPIANPDVLDILSIVLTFVGVAGYAVYKWISRSILEEMRDRMEKERTYIDTNAHLVLGVMHWRMYETLYKSKTESTDKDPEGAALEAIQWSINEMELVLKKFASLDVVAYAMENSVNQNNYAYYLTLKWNYYREDRTDDEFEKLLKSRKMSREYVIDKRQVENCIVCMDTAKELADKNRQRQLTESFENTRALVKKVFSFEPKESPFL